MPDFAYVAKSVSGERSEGVIVAASRRELQQLRRKSLFPLTVTDATPAAKQLNLQLPWAGRVSKEAVADMCTQLADLLTNGVPLLEAISTLADATVQPRLQEALRSVHDKVAEGANLDDAMAIEGDVFSELTISMVRAGLEGAFLEEALERTAGFLKKQDELRAKIVGSLTYPIILAIVGSTITAGLIVFLVPKFQPFFDRLTQPGAGLPLVTVILLAISHGLMKYGWILAIGIAAAVFQARGADSRRSRGRTWFDRVKLKPPAVRPDLPRRRGFAIVPSPWHAAAQRRAAAQEPPDQRRVDWQFTVGPGRFGLGRQRHRR
ncbi:MAG: type II secretion system F family protein [Pirellulaceae bacterium]